MKTTYFPKNIPGIFYGLRWLEILFACLTTAGCVAVLVGAGAGVGTYVYTNGNLKRTYQAKYEKTLQACLEILRDLDLAVEEKTSDGVKTTIQTVRKDGTPMTIQVSIAGVEWTEVSVRTGFVGFWKKDISQQFHEFLAKRLQQS